MAELTDKTGLRERLGFDQEYGFSEIRKILILLALLALLVIIVGVAITFGAYNISVFDVY